MLFFFLGNKKVSKNRGQKTRTRAKSLEGIQSEGGRVSGLVVFLNRKKLATHNKRVT